MQTRRLGNSDLNITTIGFGAWAIGGGDWAFGWGPQDDADSVATIRGALDLGINWIDTAAVYGLGHSEEVVAKALEGVKNRPYVFTKCARIWDQNRQIGKSLKAASIRAECEASLKRLKVDVIDLYQIHWPEPPEDIDEGWQTVVKLKEEGKIRWAGVSNFSAEQMAQVSKFGPITSLQPPYSMIRPEVEASVLPYCLANNIGVIAYSPMASGLLTGAMTRERIAAMPADDWRKEKNRHYQEPLLTRNLNLVELLKAIGTRHGRTPGEVAIAWALRHPAVTGAIVGARKPGQLKELVGAADWRLTPAEIGEIDGYLKANPA
ncbi:General stress protein 69 [Gemmata sp. SH-PL17]|uniref:aldo/keto reductase n=1 Tax=Gemmata sp. SH-PL17 TaxID=1630693 RepID=UPI0004AE7781|nr:aldo/keto reductase [Gemmata sp. SH-PL17]AMV23130.1 General stress protein 69 [Gemmata sp. SH-PL17]